MSRPAYAQQLRCQWAELTASDWPKALALADSTCILPISVLEKHGPHAPIGSDIIQARAWAQGAAKQEFAVVFPDYFYGQLNEARHQPGTSTASSSQRVHMPARGAL
ncbi:MAG: creatininase family protein [Janthinobacterium lividum]